MQNDQVLSYSKNMIDFIQSLCYENTMTHILHKFQRFCLNSSQAESLGNIFHTPSNVTVGFTIDTYPSSIIRLDAIFVKNQENLSLGGQAKTAKTVGIKTTRYGAILKERQYNYLKDKKFHALRFEMGSDNAIKQSEISEKKSNSYVTKLMHSMGKIYSTRDNTSKYNDLCFVLIGKEMLEYPDKYKEVAEAFLQNLKNFLALPSDSTDTSPQP